MMSLFGSLMGDVEDDPFFGSHMRHMRQMNNMMNSLFSDPFGMFGGGGPLALTGAHHGSSLMPFMPQMPSLNRLFSGGLDGGLGHASSYSSSTVVMSSGPNGKPQVYSTTSSTKIGPNGVKETRKTLQDSRTGTKKMSIGHHIGERGHVIEREQNLYSGDREESQEYINIEEDEADEFDREFQAKAGMLSASYRPRIMEAPRRSPPLLALPAPPAAPPAATAHSSGESRQANSESSRRVSNYRPSARRPLRTTASPLTTTSSASVREIYGGSHPQRHRHRHSKHKHADN